MYDIYTIGRIKHPRGYYERKKETEFLKESIFVSGDFSGLCVKMVRKYFIIACKKKGGTDKLRS